MPHANSRPLTTNGFKVDPPDTIDVIVREFPNPEQEIGNLFARDRFDYDCLRHQRSKYATFTT
jgi:hypothetical protein